MRGDAELRALLQLRALPRVGDRLVNDLLTRYGSAVEALRAPASELGEAALRARGTRPIRERVERALRSADELGIEILTLRDRRYPAALRELYDPPPVLFALGRLELLTRPAVAIVGAREPSSYGRDLARGLAGGVSRSGLVVLSGMARGIDGIAHRAALEGGTIGVLGCGVDVVYPRQHIELYNEVRALGLLLSEFLPGEPPLRYHFPRRNRLIAALSRGVLVVEASRRSGSLITAEHALDIGREVMAVPGPIGRELSVGTNELLRDGATIVLGVRDILDALGLGLAVEGEAPELGLVVEPGPPAGLGERALRLWRALEVEPRHAELVAAEAGLDPATTLAGLLELELRGHIDQLPGLRFVRRVEPSALG